MVARSVLLFALSVLLFALAAVAEIGGAYPSCGLASARAAGEWVAVLGGLSLVAYGLIATLQPQREFGRVLAAYGGVFIVGSLCWAAAFDGFRPDRFDLAGAALALAGVVVIMYVPR